MLVIMVIIILMSLFLTTGIEIARPECLRSRSIHSMCTSTKKENLGRFEAIFLPFSSFSVAIQFGNEKNT
jgi:hypothetical protein